MTYETAPFDRTLPSPLAALAALRASGEESVVATGRQSNRQRAMYVTTNLESNLARYVEEQPGLRLIILSGSAGGGKSALIRILNGLLPPGSVTQIVEDATHADSPSQDQTRKLADVLAGFAVGVPPEGELAVVAANTGLLLELDREFRQTGEYNLADVTAFALHKLGVPNTPTVELARRQALNTAVLVVDLDQRPTTGDKERLLRKMLLTVEPSLPTGILQGAARCASCTIQNWCAPIANAELLADPQIGEELDAAVEQIALQRGRDITPRQLWDLVSELALGGLSGQADPCDSIAAIAAAKDRAAVWRGLLPNGAFEGPSNGSLMKALADLDPSLRAIPEAHEVIASAGIVPMEDADYLNALLGSAKSRPAVATAGQALGALDATALPRARGLVRAGWLAGRIPLGSAVPPAFRAALGDRYEDVRQTREMVAEGFARAFGVRAGGTFLPTESPGETQTVQVLVEIDLIDEIDIEPPRAQDRNPEGCGVVGMRPLAARLRIGQSYFDFDLALYRLLEAAAHGALPATVDIERFHGLRYAAERLGRRAADDSSRPLLVTDAGRSNRYRITFQQWRGRQEIRIEKVA